MSLADWVAMVQPFLTAFLLPTGGVGLVLVVFVLILVFTSGIARRYGDQGGGVNDVRFH